jgi:hypothetical protein
MKTDTPALPQSITVIGRRWFQRTYGNTYHTAEIIVDGETVHTTPREYGYGDQYTDTALRWMVENGIIPAKGEYESHWRHIQGLGIIYTYSAVDVGRKKDL